MNYFIADLHNGDKNILTYEHRPFENTKEQEKVLIDNWNKTCSATDTIYNT